VSKKDGPLANRLTHPSGPKELKMHLRGKSCIVTGASRGLGVHIAERLARSGADLTLAARSAEELDKTAERVNRYGTRVLTVPTDVNKKTDLKNLVKKTDAEFGQVDVLINNAGIESVSNFHRQSLAEIESILKTNIVALELLTRLVLDQMVERKNGHIVNIASLAGKTAVPYNTVYSSSKHAVVGFSLSLREELKGYGVGVSVVCPTFVSDAGMFATGRPEQDAPKVATLVSPADVAEAVIKTIEKNKAEILVTKGLSRLVDVAHAISPSATARIQEASGVTGYMRKMARRNGGDDRVSSDSTRPEGQGDSIDDRASSDSKLPEGRGDPIE
jgi:short-subunit dehydrogenase